MGEPRGCIFGRSLHADGGMKEGGKDTRILSRLEALSGKGRALLGRKQGVLWGPPQS